MTFPYFFGIFLPFLGCQFAMKHSKMNCDIIFERFVQMEYTQYIQQHLDEDASASPSNSPNANDSFERNNQNNEKTKNCYKGTISPPGRYAIIAWDGLVNETDKECQQKIRMLTKGKEKLFFFRDAFDELPKLAKCFRYFFMARSDANGQVELRHNLLVENAQNDSLWCSSIRSSADFFSKFLFREANRQNNGNDPLRFVQLQILPLDTKGKPLPSPDDIKVAVQIQRKYKAEDLCNANRASDQQLPFNGDSIDYHPANTRRKTAIAILDHWTNSSELVAENVFFLVAYLRFVVFEVETCFANGVSGSNRDSVVAIMAKYGNFFSMKDKVAVLLLKYGAALTIAFEQWQKIIHIGLFGTNFLMELFGMTNRMCALLKRVPQIGKMFKSWQTFCWEFDLAYAQFSKKRNKWIFTLLDRCLFSDSFCYLGQKVFYHIVHLVFQIEWIVSDKASTNAEINENDQNFLAQIGQILSVASANKNEKNENKMSYFEEKANSLGRQMNTLFGRICKNWQNFMEKFANNKIKFKAWTKLCKKIANIYRERNEQII